MGNSSSQIAPEEHQAEPDDLKVSGSSALQPIADEDGPTPRGKSDKRNFERQGRKSSNAEGSEDDVLSEYNQPPSSPPVAMKQRQQKEPASIMGTPTLVGSKKRKRKSGSAGGDSGAVAPDMPRSPGETPQQHKKKKSRTSSTGEISSTVPSHGPVVTNVIEPLSTPKQVAVRGLASNTPATGTLTKSQKKRLRKNAKKLQTNRSTSDLASRHDHVSPETEPNKIASNAPSLGQGIQRSIAQLERSVEPQNSPYMMRRARTNGKDNATIRMRNKENLIDDEAGKSLDAKSSPPTMSRPVSSATPIHNMVNAFTPINNKVVPASIVSAKPQLSQRPMSKDYISSETDSEYDAPSSPPPDDSDLGGAEGSIGKGQGNILEASELESRTSEFEDEKEQEDLDVQHAMREQAKDFAAYQSNSEKAHTVAEVDNTRAIENEEKVPPSTEPDVLPISKGSASKAQKVYGTKSAAARFQQLLRQQRLTSPPSSIVHSDTTNVERPPRRRAKDMSNDHELSENSEHSVAATAESDYSLLDMHTPKRRKLPSLNTTPASAVPESRKKNLKSAQKSDAKANRTYLPKKGRSSAVIVDSDAEAGSVSEADSLIENQVDYPTAPLLNGPSSGAFNEDEHKVICQFRDEWCDANSKNEFQFNDQCHKDARLVPEIQKFWAEMNKSLPNRKRLAVIKYCRRKFHNFEKRGTWTDQEDRQIKALMAKHGMSWVKIGNEMGRMAEDVRDRYRNYLVAGSNREQMKWSNFEVKELRRAIGDCVIRVMQEDCGDDEEFFSGQYIRENLDSVCSSGTVTDWGQVSKELDGRRSRIQCSYKWRKLMEADETSLGREVEHAWDRLQKAYVENDGRKQGSTADTEYGNEDESDDDHDDDNDVERESAARTVVGPSESMSRRTERTEKKKKQQSAPVMASSSEEDDANEKAMDMNTSDQQSDGEDDLFVRGERSNPSEASVSREKASGQSSCGTRVGASSSACTTDASKDDEGDGWWKQRSRQLAEIQEKQRSKRRRTQQQQ
jgi:hypothetical protein